MMGKGCHFSVMHGLLILVLLLLDPQLMAEAIETKKIASLMYESAPVSGGSALAYLESVIYIIPDNSSLIYRTNHGDFCDLESIRLMEKDLSTDPKLRKKQKPDWEAAVVLPPLLGQKGKHLLVIPSGSKKKRVIGAILHHEGAKLVGKEPVDFSELYKKLRTIFKKLNIEGALVVGDRLLLFQRGNAKDSKNGIIYLDLKTTLVKEHGFRLQAKSIVDIKTIDLGKTTNGISYGFSDATLVHDKIYFLASAEATNDASLDGEVFGSLFGQLSTAGAILKREKFAGKLKFEGIIASTEHEKTQKFLLISDGDDDALASEIHEFEITKTGIH